MIQGILLHSEENRFRNWTVWKLIALLLIISLLVPVTGAVYARASVCVNAENITVDCGGRENSVKSLLVSNASERYISLCDMSVVLKGTDKAFTVMMSGKDISIVKGASTERESTNPYSSEDTFEKRRINLTDGKLSINDVESAYTCVIDDLGGKTDCFMRMSDFVMMIDIDMTYDGIWHVDTEKGFTVSKERLVEDGFFDGIDAALIGDATTGEIFFDYEGDVKLEIASTTKLISYAVIMDAIDSGEINENDMVTISESASWLSKSEDGVVEYEAGEVIPVRELIIAMLLPSSNESAYAMAEYICGSEDEFVKRMVEKLEELGVTDAEIYNSHGLPVFSGETVSSKNQNRMSASDMFKVVTYIINNYPQVTEITSMKTADLTYAGQMVKNTNGLLKNMPEVNGLKTGTTTKAGACLVASCRDTNEAGDEHTLVAILYGAESNTARVSYGEVLMRLAKQEFENGASGNSGGSVITFNETPDAKKLLSQVLKNARMKGIIN